MHSNPTPRQHKYPAAAPDPDGATGLSLTQRLVRLCQRDISDADRTVAAALLLDWIGVAAAGAVTPTGRALRAGQPRGAQDGPCSALALGRASAEQAAYLNGSYGTLLEMDDLHRASILHAGDVVIPAALAHGQEAGCTGAALLDAIVTGYEVALRIGTAAAQGGYSAWYNSGTCGVYGAAMSAAHAGGLSQDRTCDALGHAGMQAAGLWQCRLEPTDSKCLATAHAARAGISAARAAACGLRGPREILEGALGFFATLYPSANTTGICADHPGWAIHEVSLKPWPACRHVHPAIGVALTLGNDMDIPAIREVAVESYAAGVSFCDQPAPETPHQARFSFQHALAVSLLHGPPGLAHFTQSALVDPTIRQVRDKITVSENPDLTAAFPDRMGAAVTITLTDGTQRTATSADAPGDPETPLSREALEAKYQTNLAAAGAGQSVADQLMQTITDLGGAATLADLTRDLDALTADIIRNPTEGLIA